ncbi:MAG: hypothetical protein AB8B61_10590, partial [Cyclobacteriaceae bacterium]
MSNRNLLVSLLFLVLSFSVSYGQSVGVGTTSPNSTIAILHVKVPNATAQPQGLVLPQLTTAQMNAIPVTGVAEADGLVVYDSTTHQIKYYDANAAAWRTLDTSSVSGGGTDSQSISFSLDGDSILISGGTGLQLSAASPTLNQVLQFNGTNWDAVILDIGDADSTNELQDISFNAAGDSILITNGAGIRFSAGVP